MSRWAPLVLALLLAAAPASGARPPAGDGSGELEKAQEAFGAGRYLEALARARLAADAAPASLPAVLGPGGMAEDMGELDAAAAFYARPAELPATDPTLISRAASSGVRIGEYDRALGNLDRLLELHPRHVRWLFAWGPGPIQPVLLKLYPSLVHIA